MKKLFLSLIILVLSSLTYSVNAQTFCAQWKRLQDTIQTRHYSPKKVNDDMSRAVFDLFIKDLDSKGSHLLEEDIVRFKKDRLKLDDYVLSGECSFINSYAALFSKRLEETKEIIKTTRSSQIENSNPPTLVFSTNQEPTFFKNLNAKKNYWNKILTYRTITRYLNQTDPKDQSKGHFFTKQEEYHSEVVKNALCNIEELTTIQGSITKHLQSMILNAHTTYQDPHSRFFDAKEKTSYNASLNTKTLSTGINTFKNSEGAIEVRYITPGSTAFKNKKIKEGDIIISVILNDKTVELSCFSNRELEQLIQDPAIKEVTYNLLTEDGVQAQVTLPKTPVIVEENSLTGFVIAQEKRVGFISIPSFYRDQESPSGLGMSNDVAREIYKLQKMNIDALILDVRNNGGGSMGEAINLSGLFIDRGPVAIIKDNKGNNTTLRDFNRGVIFDKPLAVMVNEYSASASEFFAAAIQDYNRGLIIGSPTYGKSSAQTIIPLTKETDTTSSDYAKLTIEAFYRTTGKSHQSKGIIPDIQLPSIYKEIARSEQQKIYALPNDTTKVTLKARVGNPIDIEKLQERSKERTLSNDQLRRIKDDNAILKAFFNTKDEILVTYKDVKEYRDKRKKILKKFDLDHSSDQPLPIENTTTTATINSIDPGSLTANKKLLKELSSDPYIAETVNILKDYLQLN